jgi:glutamate formiminotransferase
LANQVLAVPNWSGIDLPLPDLPGVEIHFHAGDADHERTVTAYSGCPAAVHLATMTLAEAWLPLIDLRRQHGVHPRIGALDVCPFVGEFDVLALAEEFHHRFAIPVTLYGLSANGRLLPDVRRGLYPPDFGHDPHPHWGTTVMGRREFLVALNVNFRDLSLAAAKSIAKEIRHRREAGDPLLSGVRALGLELSRRGLTQVSLNLTQPDGTPIDPIVEWIESIAGQPGDVELVGVIHQRHLPAANRVSPSPEQIIRF